MIDHLYPIAFLGGSGGTFLSSWLNEAAYGIPVKLNDTGNAHQSSKYAGFSIFDEQSDAIESLKKKYIGSSIKLFVASHIVDNELLLSSFAKCTKLTYDLDDTLDIAINFYAKNSIYSSQDVRSFINSRLKATEQFNAAMTIRLPESEKYSNVSWKELLYGDSSSLINYLSNFYSIDSSRFNVDILARWRELTLNNIYTVKPKL